MGKLGKSIGCIREFLGSPHIQMALVNGFWIVAFAYVSKRVLPRPLDKVWLALPPLMFTFHEYALVSKKFTVMRRTWIWLIAFSAINLLIVGIHLYRAGMI